MIYINDISKKYINLLFHDKKRLHVIHLLEKYINSIYRNKKRLYIMIYQEKCQFNISLIFFFDISRYIIVIYFSNISFIYLPNILWYVSWHLFMIYYFNILWYINLVTKSFDISWYVTISDMSLTCQLTSRSWVNVIYL